MKFRHYDCLRTCTIVAGYLSFSRAAEELSLTKGAISYQVGQLEEALGFEIFVRRHRAIVLTERGSALVETARSAFKNIDREIASQREDRGNQIAIGMTTYFASRWLTPRLMKFMSNSPDVSLRLQPLLDMSDMKIDELDMVIRWGNGKWDDMQIERLFLCPVFATAGTRSMQQIKKRGLKPALSNLTLLQDHEDSLAWSEWHRVAKLPFRKTRSMLVIPDPNVRVQSTAHDQGVALNDRLVDPEIRDGLLHQISDVTLDDYGYFLAYPPEATVTPAIQSFREWLYAEAAQYVASDLLPLG